MPHIDPSPTTAIDALRSGLDTKHIATENENSPYELLCREPGLQSRIRDIIRVIDIRKKRPLELGYSEKPLIYVDLLLDILGNSTLLHDESYDARDRKHAFGKAILDSCIEVRDDLEQILQSDGNSEIVNESFDSLPKTLQLIVLLKSFDGEKGSVASAAQLHIGSKERIKIITYLIGSGMEEDEAEDLVDAVCLVHAPAIINGYITVHTLRQKDNELPIYTHDGNKYFKGPVASYSGIYLPENIEIATQDTYVLEYGIDCLNWIGSANERGGLSEEEKRRVEDMRVALDTAFGMSDRPEDEKALWISYLVSKSILKKSFLGTRHEGFDAGIDQLSSWIDPIPDKEYEVKFKRALDTIENWSTLADFDPSGYELALHSFALGLVESIERSIIIGENEGREGRLKVLAKICNLLEGPLSENILSRTPMLARQVEITKNPWNARYRT